MADAGSSRGAAATIGSIMAAVDGLVDACKPLRDNVDQRPLGDRDAIVSLAAAKRVYADRRRRDQLFPHGLFRDPAWDIMLDLFIAQVEGRAISVSSACIAAAVPGTTALRYVIDLEEHGIVTRRRSTADRRRSHLSLTEMAYQTMKRYFAEGCR